MRKVLPNSFGDFLRRIAFDYVRHGYHRYVIRKIPEGKDLEAIDEKLCRTYDVTSCRTKRMRMRQQGLATIQYLRWRHTFVLLATDGHHEAFQGLKSYNIREVPIHLGSYSIGLQGNKVSIQVAQRAWNRVIRCIRPIELDNQDKVEKVLAALPFYNFPGVVTQKRKLLRQLNRRRKQAGLPQLNFATLPKDQYVNARNYGPFPVEAPAAPPRPDTQGLSKA